MKSRLLLLLLLLPVIAGPARAGIIFGRKPAPKPSPAEYVPQLIAQVRTDGDENKRAAAIGELRQFDPAQYPDLIPTLIDALHNDKKPYVRAEAAQTLGKLRPLQPQIAAALEQSLAKDWSMRVRLQARSALIQYHWSGVHGAKKDEPPPVLTAPPRGPHGQTQEPPLAEPEGKAPPVMPPSVAPPAPAPAPPPPAPVPTPSPEPAPPTGGVKPLPVGPSVPATPQPKPEEKGPELPPPE
jgi:hypothetical protein